ncbi:hypothetical protein PF005_g21805, partial [Phytophthora fragariae]
MRRIRASLSKSWTNVQTKSVPDRSMSTWSAHYFAQQEQLKGQQKLSSKLRPAAIGTGIAVFGR